MWLWATVENTWGAPTVAAVTFFHWRICQLTREYCNWKWPTLLRVNMISAVNSRNPAFWGCLIRSRTADGHTLPAESVDPVPFSAGPIWRWPSAQSWARRHSVSYFEPPCSIDCVRVRQTILAVPRATYLSQWLSTADTNDCNTKLFTGWVQSSLRSHVWGTCSFIKNWMRQNKQKHSLKMPGNQSAISVSCSQRRFQGYVRATRRSMKEKTSEGQRRTASA